MMVSEYNFNDYPTTTVAAYQHIILFVIACGHVTVRSYNKIVLYTSADNF